MIAKGVQRWSADNAALIIEQLGLCSELISLLKSLASHYAPSARWRWLAVAQDGHTEVLLQPHKLLHDSSLKGLEV